MITHRKFCPRCNGVTKHNQYGACDPCIKKADDNVEDLTSLLDIQRFSQGYDYDDQC